MNEGRWLGRSTLFVSSTTIRASLLPIELTLDSYADKSSELI